MNIPEYILNTLTDEQLQSLSGGHIGGCVPVTACSNVCTADEWW